ncbi:uncharacterized protein Z518_01289 [Rhinocladiella mackenziei CBS 650.93]|uniref:Rhinocladiella mackenziei CBS 650.93 unplaced genomic scaffold supercont1.1, whole genome shotgun sequence n=1 Tax=Rhinocladiella mackenziei CBS 650.93 TaxID=1442369 RepID=A0A0D2HHP8_9EURO|nr:uncharacterized protein Z518_01289 [Rhinocladiella mackenziei CBS 650.93]KIX10208.1 hypothetical protein Z518_01289 [Rhinocladiella mackenziei CBS 650.93]
MPRRGQGSGKRGPDLSWDDEEDNASTPISNKPEEQFPPIELPVPRPVSAPEASIVKHYLSFRSRARDGPYYSILDPSSVVDEKGKVSKRAGFDPFNDQDKYTAKYHQKKRAVPDLCGREYALRFFPHELWPLLDPDRKNPLWKSSEIDIDIATNTPRKSLKRRRELVIDDDEDEDDEGKAANSDNDTDGSDPLLSGSRRSRNGARVAKAKRRREEASSKRKSREKRGLDAEDAFSDNDEEVRRRTHPRDRRKKTANNDSDGEDDDDDDDEHFHGDHDEQNNDDNASEDDDDGSGDDDEPVDSEFEESDDGEGDDYNAENYFDTGEADDDDGFAFGRGGGDEEGGYF